MISHTWLFPDRLTKTSTNFFILAPKVFYLHPFLSLEVGMSLKNHLTQTKSHAEQCHEKSQERELKKSKRKWNIRLSMKMPNLLLQNKQRVCFLSSFEQSLQENSKTENTKVTIQLIDDCNIVGPEKKRMKTKLLCEMFYAQRNISQAQQQSFGASGMTHDNIVGQNTTTNEMAEEHHHSTNTLNSGVNSIVSVTHA